ncbi:MAG: polysaccharide deacetylase family protein [Rhizobiales bacterium]|nr:polysaccharide deacetylase family protein [Hyphomicrobiales bacterium]
MPAAPDFSGFVVTLHHVRPREPGAFDPNGILSVTPEFLDSFLARFRSAGWRFVPAAELVGSGTYPDGARRLAVTLDDGFRDNLQHALPVFRRHSAPFTIYVCPGFSDRTSELWWEALERIIAAADAVAVDGHGPAPRLSARTPAEKQRAFQLWAKWLTTEADETRQRVAIRALAAAYGLNLAELARELVMDWDEVRAVAADPLCAIGAHTMTHPALARLPPDAALRQMRESADRIEAEIGVRPRTIAFPYGYPAAASAREARLAEEAGFAASFTTQPGYISTRGSRHALPRVSVNGLYQELRYLDALLTPGLWRLRNRIRSRR